MTSEYYPLFSITAPIERILGEHPNIDGLLYGVEQSPAELQSMLQGFDSAISGYNALAVTEVPEGFAHTMAAKSVIEQLPTIADMMGDTESSIFYTFARTLHEMSPLMQRAEQQLEEPYMAFHIWKDATQSEQLMGGLFQMYGTVIANLIIGRHAAESEKHILRDTVLDALIEVMALQQDMDNPVFVAVKGQGWFEAKKFDGVSDLFTEDVRKLVV